MATEELWQCSFEIEWTTHATQDMLDSGKLKKGQQQQKAVYAVKLFSFLPVESA